MLPDAPSVSHPSVEDTLTDMPEATSGGQHSDLAF